MFTASIPFLVSILILFEDISIVNGGKDEEKCSQQTSYAVLPNKAQSLTTNLFYDASKDLDTDMGFIWAMCLAQKTFQTEAFNFIVGASVKAGNGGIECPHNNGKYNNDCKDNIEHACAFKLIPNKFSNFVCCTNNGKSASMCLQALDRNKKQEFDQCVQLKHPNIKPDQVLLSNAQAARNTGSKEYPVLTFNGKIADPCARYMFFNDPIKAVCNLLTNCT